MQLREEDGGTRIRGRTGLSTSVLVFMAVWVGVILLFMLGGFVGLLTGQPSAVFLLVSPLMLGFMVALVAIGRGLSQGDEALLMTFVRETLQAREIAVEPDRT